MVYLITLGVLLLSIGSYARKLGFPSVAGIPLHQDALHGSDDVDIVTGSAFSGLTTFAHMPYSNCFMDGEGAEDYDIAILGAPFDTVSRVSFLIKLAGNVS